eukprot:sb/3473610/
MRERERDREREIEREMRERDTEREREREREREIQIQIQIQIQITAITCWGNNLVLVTQFPLHCGHAKTCLTFAMPFVTKTCYRDQITSWTKAPNKGALHEKALPKTQTTQARGKQLLQRRTLKIKQLICRDYCLIAQLFISKNQIQTH